jgi:hypothetical protein
MIFYISLCKKVKNKKGKNMEEQKQSLDDKIMKALYEKIIKKETETKQVGWLNVIFLIITLSVISYIQLYVYDYSNVSTSFNVFGLYMFATMFFALSLKVRKTKKVSVYKNVSEIKEEMKKHDFELSRFFERNKEKEDYGLSSFETKGK